MWFVIHGVPKDLYFRTVGETSCQVLCKARVPVVACGFLVANPINSNLECGRLNTSSHTCTFARSRKCNLVAWLRFPWAHCLMVGHLMDKGCIRWWGQREDQSNTWIPCLGYMTMSFYMSICWKKEMFQSCLCSLSPSWALHVHTWVLHDQSPCMSV